MRLSFTTKRLPYMNLIRHLKTLAVILLLIAAQTTRGTDVDHTKDEGYLNGLRDVAGSLPQWQVSEPYLNLWIVDEPLAYKTSSGEVVSFTMAYKQHDVAINTNI